MARWGILGVLAVPIIEIALFIVIGGAIGLLASFAWIIATFVLGVAVMRRQTAPQRAAQDVTAAAHKVLIFFAAIFLILPGFFTDAIGLLLLIRPLRALLAGRINAGMVARFGGMAGQRAPDQGDVLDGDYVDVTPNPTRSALQED